MGNFLKNCDLPETIKFTYTVLLLPQPWFYSFNIHSAYVSECLLCSMNALWQITPHRLQNNYKLSQVFCRKEVREHLTKKMDITWGRENLIKEMSFDLRSEGSVWRRIFRCKKQYMQKSHGGKSTELKGALGSSSVTEMMKCRRV